VKEINGRKVIFKCVVGSPNYNLDTPESDRDYKYFVYPTVHDLYRHHYYHVSHRTAKVDYEVHDIRRLGELLMKSNPNYLEVLYSQEYEWQDESFRHFLMHKRDQISKMNLPKLWSSLYGLGQEKENKLLKGTASTRHLVDKFGYDTKQAMHAVRAYHMIFKLAVSHFDFERSLWSPSSDEKSDAPGRFPRDLFLSIKHGLYSLQHVQELLATYRQDAKELEDRFKAQPLNTRLFEQLENFIAYQVMRHLMQENLMDYVSCEELQNMLKSPRCEVKCNEGV
jgi:predicted nucleotidyltransferase